MKWLRKAFLPSGNGDQWDLLRALTYSAAFGLAVGLVVHTPSFVVTLAAIGFTVTLIAVFWLILRKVLT